MSEEKQGSLERYAVWTLEDAQLRLQYQHEYTLAGLKALILINGGAIIGLLTYAGNANSRLPAGQLEGSFGWYVAGLALGVFAYIAAYLSQGEFMHFSTLQAQRMLGLATPPGRSAESHVKVGTAAVYLAIAFALISLASFALGSLGAMKAITRTSEATQTGKSQPPRLLLQAK